MRKGFSRFLCLSLLFSFLLSLFPQKGAAVETASASGVIETDVGIQPFDYKRMISTRTENQYNVKVETDGGTSKNARIHIRGCGSKEAGMMLPTKRLPIELRFERASDFSAKIANSCVKFCNVVTPFELLAQHIAYDMFAFMGIPSPAHAFTFLQYNDVDFGLFFALEDINGEFLAKHFREPFGALYKGAEGEPSQPYAYSSWFGELRAVNDGDTEGIMQLLTALKEGEGYEAYLDVDEVLRFFACTAAYGGASSILTEQSNFFLYDNNGRFMLLPWDLSEAFSAEATQNGVDRFRMEFWEEAPPSPLFDLLMQKEENRERYHGYIREICDGFLAPAVFDPYFTSLAARALPYLERDHTVWFNWETQAPEDAPDLPVTFRSLQTIVHEIHRNLLAQLDGSADRFYVSPTLEELREEIGDEMVYVVRNTFTMDRKITRKICKGYTSYCRSRGISRFETGDPAEAVTAGAFFALSFGLSVVFARQKKQKKRTEEANNG